MITLIRKVDPAELDGAFLWDFDTYHCYHRKWEKADGLWSLKPTSVVRQWSDDKKRQITRYLAWLIAAGGRVFGAFAEGRLVGFAALDKDFGGSEEQYMNLTMLFVDARYHRRNVGRFLFDECAKEAAGLGARKLFISSIPAENTVAFYFSMGCQDAKESISGWEDMPYDRYLEFAIEKYEIKPRVKAEPKDKLIVGEPAAEEETSNGRAEAGAEEKAEEQTDEAGTSGSVLRQRRRRNRGAKGRRGPGGAQQRPVPRRTDSDPGGADRSQA